MGTVETLRDEGDAIDHVLATLRVLRLAIISGCAPTPRQVERIIAFIEDSVAYEAASDARQAQQLLAVLRRTVTRLGEDSGAARRQFFHAARAYLTIRKGQLDDVRSFLVGQSALPVTA
jgi:hemerythrin-like domain-containing protein